MHNVPPAAVDHLRAVLDVPDLTGTKYRLVQRIATGGMGSIYLVEDTSLDRKVALKIITTPFASGDLAPRLIQEARIVARLEHPGIVPLHDVGTLVDGRVFYTMKYVQGRRLDEYAREYRSLQNLLRVFQKICEAVAFAHANGVIHRDLKPENIMVGSFGEVLVMDWGVAKVLTESEPLPPTSPDRGAGDPTGTRQGTILGTPAYMAPEQARGDLSALSEQTDIYALGAILYFLLTGRTPFNGSSSSEIREKVLHEPPPQPRLLDPKIPRPLEAMALKAMAKDPAARYPGIGQLSSDVIRHLDGQTVSAYRETLFERVDRWVEKNRFLIFLIVAYLLMRVFTFLTMGR